jgi:Beta-propeller repeat
VQGLGSSEGPVHFARDAGDHNMGIMVQAALNGGAFFEVDVAVRAWRQTAAAVALFATVFVVPALGQDQIWLRQFGTSSPDYVADVLADGAGGVFVCGHTSGSLGGPNAGGQFTNDAFLARNDAAGTLIWIRQFGTVYNDRAVALASDGAGGVIVAGPTGSEFGSGLDIYLARYDEDGNRLWTTRFGSSEFDYVGTLKADGLGGVYVGGRTAGDLGGSNAGSTDAFVGHFDRAGNQIWLVQFGTVNQEWTTAVERDGAGGVYATGFMDGSLFGPKDAFLARYDPTGQRMWLRRFTSGGDSTATALATAVGQGVFVGGFTDGSLGGPNKGGSDAFLTLFDKFGRQKWVRQFGTSKGDGVYAMEPDGSRGVLVAGVIEHESNGLFGPFFSDAFLARFDGTGAQRWLSQFGSPAGDIATSLAGDGAGGVFVGGITHGNLGGPRAGESDAFLARYFAATCYADCDQSTGFGALDIFDFLCFQNALVNGDPYACDCDTSTGRYVCDIFDFLCFQISFLGGCP